MLHSNLDVNAQGHLTMAGVDTVEMAGKYGTPLYLLDEGRVRENCRAYAKSMERYFPENSMALLAGKALCFKKIYPIALEEGLGADVVSSGEIYTALKAGFPAEKMYFHGNGKTDDDIIFALDHGIGWFVVDNAEELGRIDCFAGERGIRQKILLRLTPGIDPHTFEAVSTGKVDSKFGLVIENGQARRMTEYALGHKNLDLRGFHCHIGSQIFDCEPFFDAAEVMLQFIADMRDAYGYTASVLNLGGGFGVRYVEEDPAIDYETNLREIGAFIQQQCQKLQLTPPAILMEPGRSIVADAGLTLYTVQSLKSIPGYKDYVIVDGGMTDDPRYALYGSLYTAVVANKADQPADFSCTLAGRCCESGDLIGENMRLTQPERGDTVAVLVTGAYNYSMASNYNRICRPPIVLLRNGEDELAVRRETFEDLTACDL